MDKRKRFPVVYCKHCKKDTLAILSDFESKDGKIKLTVVHCPHCEYVLNLNEKIKLRWWLERSVEKRLGFKRGRRSTVDRRFPKP